MATRTLFNPVQSSTWVMKNVMQTYIIVVSNSLSGGPHMHFLNLEEIHSEREDETHS